MTSLTDFNLTSDHISALSTANVICLNNDLGKTSVLVLLDHRAAFDTADD